MAHIMFMAPPVTGHINPTLGVVEELAARGHRVSYATTDEYAPRVRDAGAEVVGYATTMPPPGAEPYRLKGADVARGLLDALRETRWLLAELDGPMRRNRPDVVVYDGLVAWWGRLLARRHGIPAVSCWPTFVSNDHWALHETYVTFNKLDPRLIWFALRMKRLASRAGLSLTELVDGVGTGIHGQLVFMPRSFQFAGDTFAETFHFTGPCLGRRRYQGTWRPPGDRPVLLVSFGSIYHQKPEFFTSVMDAFGGSDWHVVLSVGDRFDPAVLGTPPPNVEIHASVPQLEVLRRADLFVTHAGMGSVMEALWFGVPLIAMPQMPEQQAGADRITRLNLGRRLAVSGAGVGRALRDLADELAADEGVRAAVGRIREEMRQAGGATAAADLVEGAVGAGPSRGHAGRDSNR